MNDFVLLTIHPRAKLYSIHGKTAEFTGGHFIHNLKFNSPVHSFNKKFRLVNQSSLECIKVV